VRNQRDNLISRYEKVIKQKDVQKLECLFDETKDEIFRSYVCLPTRIVIRLLELIPHKISKLSAEEVLKLIKKVEYSGQITFTARSVIVSCFLELLDKIDEEDKQNFSDYSVRMPSHVFPLDLSISGVDFVDVVLRAYKKVPIILEVETLPVLVKRVTCEQFEDILSNSRLWRTYKTEFFDQLPHEYFEVVLKLIKEKRLSLYDTYFALPERTPKQFLDENYEAVFDYVDKYLVKEFILKKRLNIELSIFVVEAAKRFPDLIPTLGEENFAVLVNSPHPQSRTFYTILLRNPCIKNYPQVFLKALKAYCELKSHYYYELEIPDEILLKLSPKNVFNLLTKNLEYNGWSGLKMNPEILRQKIAVIALSQPEEARKILGELEAYEMRCKYNKSGVEIICDFLGISDGCRLKEIDDSNLVTIFERINSVEDSKMRKELFQFVFKYFRGDYAYELELRFKDLVQKILERT